MGNVSDFTKYKSAMDFAKVATAITRLAVSSLTTSEYTALMVLLSHTIAVSKTEVTVPLKVLVDGLAQTSDGVDKVVQDALPMSYQTLRTAIAGLERLQFITVTNNRSEKTNARLPSTYTVNVNYIMAFIQNGCGEQIELEDAGITYGTDSKLSKQVGPT